MRFYNRVDKNQGEIVIALRGIGARVEITASLGNGFPDLVVGYKDSLYLLEIKSKGGKLTQDEESFYSLWRPYVTVVYSVEDALKAIGADYDV